MRNSTKKIVAIAAALLLSVSTVATTATMAAPAVFATSNIVAGSTAPISPTDYVDGTHADNLSGVTLTGENVIIVADDQIAFGTPIAQGNLSVYVKGTDDTWYKMTTSDYELTPESNNDAAGKHTGTIKINKVATASQSVAVEFSYTVNPGDNNYVVTFNSDGGTTYSPVAVKEGKVVAEPTAPTKAGYVFAGWYNGATKFDFDTAISANTTLVAKWVSAEDAAFGITDIYYDAADSEFNVAFANRDKDTDYLVEVTVGSNTYTYVAARGTGDISFDLGDVTYKNKLVATNLTDDLSGKTATVSVYTYTAKDANSNAITTPYATVAAGEVKYANITKTLLKSETVTCSDAFVVSYELNGATGYTGQTTATSAQLATQYASKAVDTGSDLYTGAVSGLATPVKTGYDFTGWYTDAACTKEVTATSATKVTANTTLYAGWKATTEVVNVTNIGYATSAITTPVTASAGDYWVKLDNKIGTGRYLVEVVTADGTRYSKVINGDSIVNLDAKEITFALGDATYINKAAKATVTAPTAPTVGDTVTLSVYTFTCKTAAGVDKAITSYDDMANVTLVAEKAITLASAYTVTFDTQGGSTVANNTVASSGTATKPSNPTKAGYDFTGWYTDAECTKAYDFTAAVTENITLYAGWTMSANNIAGATIATIANVAYTGEAQTPALKVTLGDKELVAGTDYTVEYTNNTEVGKATATITGIGAYTGTATKNFVIVPQQVTGLKAVKKTATTLKLQFNAVEGADGYKIYDAVTGKAIASVSTQNGADVLKKTITGLNAGETRKYKVRAYKIVNGTKRYAEYSAVYTKATAKK